MGSPGWGVGCGGYCVLVPAGRRAAPWGGRADGRGGACPARRGWTEIQREAISDGPRGDLVL